MTTLTKDAEPTFDMVNMFVEQARRNDQITHRLREAGIPDNNPVLTTMNVVEHLTMQVPNRVYFNSEGVLCRVLFFSELNMPFQVRIENLQLKPDVRISRSEVFSASSPIYLEREIGLWRRRFGMSGDLLRNPVYVGARIGQGEEFVHLAGTENAVYYMYCRTLLNGPKLSGLGMAEDFVDRQDTVFIPLPEPPTFLIAHTNPFSIPTP